MLSNYDLVIGSYQQPLSDRKLEIEYLASDLLSGILYTPNFVNLVGYLADLPIITLIGDEEVTELGKKIKKKLTKDDKLNLDECKRLYYGKDSKLLEMLHLLEQRVDSIIPLVRQQDLMYTKEVFQKRLDATPSEMLSLNDWQSSEAAKSTIKTTFNGLMKISDTVRLIFENLQHLDIKCEVEVPSIPGFNKIPEYLFNAKNAMLQYPSKEIQYAPLCITILDMLQQRYPRIQSDPYQKDVYMDLVSLVKYPNSIYRKLKTMVSVDETIPMILKSIYPSILIKNIEHYWEVKKYLTYQQQIRIERGLGISKNESDITNLCEQYIYIGYNS